jgi:arabinogalactan oligomer/maltooligosaccharide transport system permease protein
VTQEDAPLSTTVVQQEPPRSSRLRLATGAAWAAPARLVAVFSGTVGFAIKIALLAVTNALAVWGGTVLAGDEKWIALVVLVAATLAIDAIYLAPGRAVPAKFLIPGTVFLIAFQIVPIVYNVNVGFTNWSTGHILTKSEAIQGIERNSLSQPANGASYLMAPARDEDGDLVLLLVDEVSGKSYLGTPDELQPLEQGAIKVSDLGVVESASGYTIVKGAGLLAIDEQLASFTVPTENGAIRPEGTEVAIELAPTLRYSRVADTFTRIDDGTVFRDDGEGSFVAASGAEELEPGWRTNIGLANFRAVLSDPLIREPFVRVFVWTFVFAASIVLISFALGLFLAIVLDKPTLRLRRAYQLLLIIPYALPAFLAVLIWGGLLNDDFGVVNNLLHAHIPWLFDPWWAKVSVIAVSVWLTVPYFLLVSLGALQSIPSELVEAARVDGGGPWQIFRRVTLPLLLVVVAPLMIASFALNFNNFVNIYLLTAGGPPAEDQSIAGATDILITYTYKLAFEAGKGNDFGLACTVSIFIFVIVALISGAAFWKTGALENTR